LEKKIRKKRGGGGQGKGSGEEGVGEKSTRYGRRSLMTEERRKRGRRGEERTLVTKLRMHSAIQEMRHKPTTRAITTANCAVSSTPISRFSYFLIRFSSSLDTFSL